MITKEQIIELLKVYPDEHLKQLFDDDTLFKIEAHYRLLIAVEKALYNEAVEKNLDKT